MMTDPAHVQSMADEQTAVAPPVVDVRDLRVHFKVHRGLLGSQLVKAVDVVSFSIAAGAALGPAGGARPDRAGPPSPARCSASTAPPTGRSCCPGPRPPGSAARTCGPTGGE